MSTSPDSPPTSNGSENMDPLVGGVNNSDQIERKEIVEAAFDSQNGALVPLRGKNIVIKSKMIGYEPDTR